MAVRTVSPLGGNWNATTTWVGGVVPSATLDTVAFTLTSGQLTVNVASTCIGINFTNYVNTITFTSLLTINGPVNLGTGGYTQVGASGIQANATATHTSGGVTWSRLWTFAGTSQTHTLSGTWTFTGTLNFSPTTAMTLTGSTINTANLTVTTASTISGTTAIIFNGTGTWSHSAAGIIRNNVTINTAGTLTIGTNIYYNTGTLTYTIGTVITTGSTLNIGGASTTTLNTNSLIWNSIDINLLNSVTSVTLVLTSNLSTSNLIVNSITLSFTTGGNILSIGTLQIATLGATIFNTPQNLQIINLIVGASNSSNCTINGVFNISISGNLTKNNGAGLLSGTTSLVLNGTGTWSSPSTTALQNNLTINTAGAITVSGNVVYSTGTLTYTAGTITTTGSTLNITGTTTLNTSGMTWNNVTTTLSITITLTSILIVEGTLSIAGSSFATSACHVKGNLTITGNTGTAGTIIINGTGNQIWSGVSRVRTDLQINKPSGILTVSGSVAFTNSILTYIAGNVDTTGSTLTIDVTSTLNTNDLFWNNISLSGGTQTLLSDLNCQNLTSAGSTINGLFNVNVDGDLTANGVVQGTSTIVLNGTGLWTATNGSNTFRTPIIINTNGIITLANTLYQGCSLTYIKGTVKSNNTTITFGGDTTTRLINLHKLIFKNVLLGASTTITMNEFFSGSPSLITNVNPTSGSNYTISFLDGFEKIAKFVNISGCTLLKPLQLLVITKSKKNSTNRGIRYINQSPNGIAKGVSSINSPMTFGAGGLLSDPNMK